MSRSGNDQSEHNRPREQRLLSPERSSAAMLGVTLLAILLLSVSSVVSGPAALHVPYTLVAQLQGSPSFDAPPVAEMAPLLPEGSMVRAAHEADRRSQTDTEPTRAIPKTEYAESWRQAGPGISRLGQTLRSHQVAVGADGVLTGRVTTLDVQNLGRIPLAEVNVDVLRGSQRIASVETDAEGHFRVAGLTTGTHALVVRDEQGLLAFSFHVLAEGETSDDPDPAVVDLPLDSLAVRPEDVAEAVKRIDVVALGVWPVIREVEPDVAQIPPDVRSIRQFGARGTPLLTHRAALQPDGRLIGRIRRLHPETGRPLLAPRVEVTFLQGGGMIDTTLTDEIGYFEIAGLVPGVYSVVAVSVPDDEQSRPLDDVAIEGQPFRRPGFAALAVEVVPADSIERTGRTDDQPARDADELLELDVALVDASGWVEYAQVTLGERSSEVLSLGAGSAASPSKVAGSARVALGTPAPVGGGFGSPNGGGGFPFPLPDDNDDAVVSPFAP